MTLVLTLPCLKHFTEELYKQKKMLTKRITNKSGFKLRSNYLSSLNKEKIVASLLDCTMEKLKYLYP